MLVMAEGGSENQVGSTPLSKTMPGGLAENGND